MSVLHVVPSFAADLVFVPRASLEIIAQTLERVKLVYIVVAFIVSAQA